MRSLSPKCLEPPTNAVLGYRGASLRNSPVYTLSLCSSLPWTRRRPRHEQENEKYSTFSTNTSRLSSVKSRPATRASRAIFLCFSPSCPLSKKPRVYMLDRTMREKTSFQEQKSTPNASPNNDICAALPREKDPVSSAMHSTFSSRTSCTLEYSSSTRDRWLSTSPTVALPSSPSDSPHS